ncbi:hypothetical protein BC354_13515 [Vibrio cholerae]|nr:hypothetical protein [Vibrio cholerae]RGP86609.1 hypothetical protein BC354_13515 [Vibrio cholerae]RGP94373.1 hypothetical protein BC352_13170 [Vibrio cholerae]
MDVNDLSLNKRWFGYRTECGLLACFALLVNYKCCESGVRAFIYATGDCFEGNVVDVLDKISSVLDSQFVKKLGFIPPPKDRGFFTQTWQGEARVIADGELFYIPPFQRLGYVPPWK